MTRRSMDDPELQAAIKAYAQRVVDEVADVPIPEEAIKIMREVARKAEEHRKIREAAHRTAESLGFVWTDEKRDQVEAIIRAGRRQQPES
ncbi:hypothetical protein MYP14_04795 [Rhodococcus pyridinivorans]|uniref:hypothetical protein n=1 Tax=Rhodococcus pyridinivorans TaxID=103816 RepID=UPI001FFE5EA6|nr:hypothetical protein [Rhodococcus pyridinivorans]UPK64684.1 hypothetical protein MYP14_04795 [Rhodococcus pyridinivorans]